MKKAKRPSKRSRKAGGKGININISNRLINTVQQLKNRARLIPRKATISIPGYTPINPFPNPGAGLVYGSSDSFSGLQSGTQLARNVGAAIYEANDQADDVGQSVPVTGLKDGTQAGSFSGRPIPTRNFMSPTKSSIRKSLSFGSGSPTGRTTTSVSRSKSGVEGVLNTALKQNEEMESLMNQAFPPKIPSFSPSNIRPGESVTLNQISASKTKEIKASKIPIPKVNKLPTNTIGSRMGVGRQPGGGGRESKIPNRFTPSK